MWVANSCMCCLRHLMKSVTGWMSFSSGLVRMFSKVTIWMLHGTFSVTLSVFAESWMHCCVDKITSYKDELTRVFDCMCLTVCVRVCMCGSEEIVIFSLCLVKEHTSRLSTADLLQCIFTDVFFQRGTQKTPHIYYFCHVRGMWEAVKCLYRAKATLRVTAECLFSQRQLIL